MVGKHVRFYLIEGKHILTGKVVHDDPFIKFKVEGTNIKRRLISIDTGENGIITIDRRQVIMEEN